MSLDDLFDPEAFLRKAGPDGPLLGLDPGTKTIGVALSDKDRRMAGPVRTIQRGKFRPDAEALAAFAATEQVVGVIIGFPINMDGSLGPRAQSVRAFRRQLSDYIDLPMLFWDERLSTEAAKETLIDAGQSRRKRHSTIDAAAAAEILNDCLRHLDAITK